MAKIYRTDLIYFNRQSMQIYGDMDWTFAEYPETTTNSIEKSIDNIKYIIDESFNDDEQISIFEIYDDTTIHELVYKIANCSEEEAKEYGINADMYYTK